jgi:hypothetical protein
MPIFPYSNWFENIRKIFYLVRNRRYFEHGVKYFSPILPQRLFGTGGILEEGLFRPFTVYKSVSVAKI